MAGSVSSRVAPALVGRRSLPNWRLGAGEVAWSERARRDRGRAGAWRSGGPRASSKALLRPGPGDSRDDHPAPEAREGGAGTRTSTISNDRADPLDAEINLEQASAQRYLAMSAHCERDSFRGFADWLKVQVGEETAHA